MKYIKGANANMTGYRGTVLTNYSELHSIFGDPDLGPNADLDKTSCEWHLAFEDGIVATIYDWVTNCRTPLGNFEWHVGGNSFDSLLRIQEIIEFHRDPLVNLLKEYELTKEK